jgi:hypothetical protein
MTSDRYERIRQIFAEACDLEGAERSRYLERECGEDKELRRELDSLLADDSQPPYSEEALRDAYLRLKLSGRVDEFERRD